MPGSFRVFCNIYEPIEVFKWFKLPLPCLKVNSAVCLQIRKKMTADCLHFRKIVSCLFTFFEKNNSCLFTLSSHVVLSKVHKLFTHVSAKSCESHAIVLEIFCGIRFWTSAPTSHPENYEKYCTSLRNMVKSNHIAKEPVQSLMQ